VESVELDDSLPWKLTSHARTHDDFFRFATGKDNSYRVIFGNPPYVALKNITATDRALIKDLTAMYSGKTNLYHLFIHRCVDLLAPSGELVFIVPGEWLYSTSATVLRGHLEKNGSITHLIDCGEEKLFSDADVPSIVIFRFVKAAKQGPIKFWCSFSDAQKKSKPQLRELLSTNGRWLIADPKLVSSMRGWIPLGSMFDVKVGLVTGLDSSYILDSSNNIETGCVIDQLTSERTLKPFLFVENFESESSIPTNALNHLLDRKQDLLSRRIKKFHQGNWWKYGAVRNLDLMKSDTPRFFANAKTRTPEPFFMKDDAKYFTGAVLGVFKKENTPISCESAVTLLNSKKFRPVLDAMMISSNGKISLQPATLSDVPMPSSEEAIRLFLEP
jgi:adenine-specific DNA-methyltransferase